MGCNQYIRQKLPVDDTSGFSGYLILGDTRIDLTTGDIYNLTGSGIISGFVGIGSISGYSGFSGFSGQAGTGIQEKELENTYQNYLFSAPVPGKVGKYDVLEFMPGVQNAVDFSFEVPEDIVLGNSLWIVLDYDMSTSQAALIRLILAYDVIDNNQSTTPALPTTVLSVLISPPVTLGTKSEYTFTIPAPDVTSRTQSIRMTLLRDGSNPLDSHGGNFRLGAISLRYVGLGSGVSGSASSGAQDDLHMVWSWMGL